MNLTCITTEFIFSNNIRYIKVSCFDHPRSDYYWHILRYLLLRFLLLLVFLYHARGYTRWRVDRVAFQAHTKPHQQATESPPLFSKWAHAFSLRWIPYLPVAVVYLVARAAWMGLRLAILYSLLAAEHAGTYLIATAKKGVQWSVNHGPEIILTMVIVPTLSVALALWESPALPAAASVIRNKVIPAVVRVALSSLETAQSAATNIIAWMQALDESARAAVTWIAVECVFNPTQALLERVATLGDTFVLIAKVYLHDLAKDAHDLGCVVAKAVAWIWARILKPLGAKLYIFGPKIVGYLADLLLWPALRIILAGMQALSCKVKELYYATAHALEHAELKPLGAKLCTFGLTTVSCLADLLLWPALRVCIRVLCILGMAALVFFGSLLYHPMVLEGMQALSCKVKELCILAPQRFKSVHWPNLWLLRMAVLQFFGDLLCHPIVLDGMQALSCKVEELCILTLQRLKDVHWLNLWQTVMSKATFLYHYLTLALQYIGQGILVLATDVLPGMYNDLTVVLKVAYLVAMRVVDDLVLGVHRSWQAMSEISWTFATNAGATLAWLREVAVPFMKLCESEIQPRLSHVAAVAISHTWTLTEAATKSAPLVASAAEHMWDALLKMVNVIQAILIQVATRTAYPTGGLGERIESLAPQFESLKEQAGCAMDGLVASLSNAMMGWAKGETK
ncbi:hypothetical protein BGZ58_003403 [Dissophora ornata]|nr:hypothetical protein BGZ58_003403 [Dissophora ornata]